jgi:translation initiation factor 2 alpha subunit (eIF-2alpha)
MENLELGDIVLCTVERVEKTIVFVNIKGYGQGSIITSEIAPGRIRNIRDYVVPKKKIVCKVLRVSGDRIDLSLRRVTQKEKKQVLEKEKQEKSYENILKSVLGEKVKEVLEKIKKQNDLVEFLNESKENPKELEKIISKEQAKKIIEILKKQKKKTRILQKEFQLKTTAPNGLSLIKELLEKVKAEIKYISAGKYSIKVESDDLKKADKAIKEILEKISEKSKKLNLDFSY